MTIRTATTSTQKTTNTKTKTMQTMTKTVMMTVIQAIYLRTHTCRKPLSIAFAPLNLIWKAPRRPKSAP